ncbi:DDE-type integrase/transposase/recombinase [Streptomyces sp. NPDC096105]|uniref:DDE-type integrase/transposase/recombinase n=1 Tax=Streptomyces sp. NPDC096105 TaxID=3366074 RepID=UPI00382849B2
MMYPLVRELAAAAAPHRVPVAVTCRVLKLARQPYYRWLDRPVTDAELAEAHRANALFDAHRDDPEFGHRFLRDEARAAGEPMAERTAWRICRNNGWRSAFGKRRGRNKNAKAGPPVHDDRVRRDFTADGPNRLWLTDITEHATDEGKLYLCAVKDVYSSRIVGYSIDARMESRLAATALESAVARRGQVAGCVVHSDRGSQGGFNRSSQHLVLGGVDGQASRVDGVVDRTVADEVPGCAGASAGSGTSVLEGNREGGALRGGGNCGWRIPGGGLQVVPSRWRHATNGSCSAVRPVPVLSRA